MRILSKNKRAGFDYDIQKRRTAGIILQGHEVKACKMDHCSITEGIIRYDAEQRSFVIVNMNIPLYSKTQHSLAPGYIPKHPRKLLLNIREITNMVASTKKSGLTIIPLQLVEMKNRRIKLEIGLAKLRKKVEKRQILRERDITKQMNRQIRDY